MEIDSDEVEIDCKTTNLNKSLQITTNNLKNVIDGD